MFVLIFENSEMLRATQVTESELSAADSGYIDLLDVSEANNPKRYDEGEWHEIELSDT